MLGNEAQLGGRGDGQTCAAEEGTFKAQRADRSLPEIVFFTQFASMASYQKWTFIQNYVTDDRRTHFHTKM